MFARPTMSAPKQPHRQLSLPVRVFEVLLGVWTVPTLMADVLWLWQQRSAERDRLLQMDDRLLNDLGLNRADADREGGKPFWQA